MFKPPKKLFFPAAASGTFGLDSTMQLEPPNPRAPPEEPPLQATNSSTSFENKSSPGLQCQRQVSATGSESSSAWSEHTEFTPLSSTANRNQRTLESASTTSSSTSELRGKFWDDALLEQPEDRPSSLMNRLSTQTLDSLAAIAAIPHASAERLLHPAALHSKRCTVYNLAEAYLSHYHFLCFRRALRRLRAARATSFGCWNQFKIR